MFHLFKQSRVYNGRPYCGPTSRGKPAEYATLDEAKKAKKEFTIRNPVGWDIFDAESGELIQECVNFSACLLPI